MNVDRVANKQRKGVQVDKNGILMFRKTGYHRNTIISDYCELA